MEFIFNTKIGNLIVDYDDNKIINVDMAGEKYCNKITNDVEERIYNEFNIYFDGKSPRINLPIKIIASDFNKKVYETLLNTKYGETITYKDLAIKVNNKNTYRAVGNAMNKNPLPFIIPCHRVLSSNGLGGYRYGMDLKRFLLKLEEENSYKFNL